MTAAKAKWDAARDRATWENQARADTLRAIENLAVKVDATWFDHDLGRERSFAWLIDQEFGQP